MSLISAAKINKAYGAKTLFADLSLTVSEGDRVGVLGRNGAGKSTLLQVLAGLVPADSGVVMRRQKIRVRYLAQEPAFEPHETPLSHVSTGLGEWQTLLAEYERVSALTATDSSMVDRQAELMSQIENSGGWEREHDVRAMLGHVGVHAVDKPLAQMSGGERRRVALAQLLVASPDLAILDEPTNHLDTGTIEWLEDYLANTFAGSVLLVTHDRWVLDAMATRIVELEEGTLHTYEGSYRDYLVARQERLALAERNEANRQNFLRREVEWLRRGAPARTTKQKARIQRAEAALSVKAPTAEQKVQLSAQSERLGNTILDFEAATVARNGRVLFAPLTLRLVPGDRVGIVGPNGVGKTSLLQLASGELAAESGLVRRGQRTKMVYFDQARADLHDDWSVFDNVAEREGAQNTGGIMVAVGKESVPLGTYLELFLFKGVAQRQKVGSLSGGERARVALAKILRSGANLLLLDEPTNDLDVSTLGALEGLLETWPGCALIVSHDRWFLTRVATAILAFEGGKWVHYQGNWETYRQLRTEPPSQTAQFADTRPIAPVTPAPAARAAPASAKPGLKLSFAEAKELAGLLDRIAEAETTHAALLAQANDPSWYAQHEKGEARTTAADKLGQQIERAKAEIERMTARWEHLEARRV